MPGVSALVLRDVQLGPAPSWWPPAPGWWLLALALLVLLAGLALWQLLLWRRRRQWQQHFDAAIAQAGAEAAAVAEQHRARDTAQLDESHPPITTPDIMLGSVPGSICMLPGAYCKIVSPSSRPEVTSMF